MDTKTAFITVALMVIANGAVLANIQRDLPQELRPAVHRWQIATLLIPIGSGLFAFGSALPGPVVVTVANAALIVGFTFFHWGIERFYGGKPSGVEVVISALAIVGVFWYSAITPNFPMRIILISMFWTVILVHSAWTLHRHRKVDPSGSRFMLLIVYMVVVTFIAVRAIVYFRAGVPEGFGVAAYNTPVNIASPIVMALLPVVGTTTFTLMCVDKMRRQLQVVATTDYLTGLANRRTLEERGEALMARARDGRGRFAAVVFDLDGFKAVNDSYGHAGGDQALIHAAAHLRTAARKNDVVVRSGGEEFVMLLDDVDEAGATAIAERIRFAIAAKPCAAGASTIPLTVSAGVAVHRPDDREFDAVILRADRALYRAKMAGRNRVEVAD